MFSWIATFDNEHNMTEVYKGSAPDESSAFKDMLATARFEADAAVSEILHGLQEVGE